jgi:PLP dependent protein
LPTEKAISSFFFEIHVFLLYNPNTMAMNIDQYLKLREDLEPKGITIVAVSKNQEPEKITTLYQAGHKDMGENRVQALVERYNNLSHQIRWHFIGHLQKNKVRYIAPFVHLIHGVDSFPLLKVIDKEAQKNKRILDCLLQFHIAKEDSKFGMKRAEAWAFLGAEGLEKLENIRVCGVMGMASLTENKSQIAAEFKELRNIFLDLKKDFFSNRDHFREISMGMSDDYRIAVDAGSTMLRIGTLIFGPRIYPVNIHTN